MYIRTTGIIGRTCAARINYRKWVGTSVDSTDPSHFEFQFWCSWMLASWSYSFSKCNVRKYQRSENFMYFRTPFHVASLRQLSASYRQLREAPWPCCYAPDSRCRSCFGHWEVSLNVDQVLRSLSLIGQWISPYFSVDASNRYLGLRCRIQWSVQVLRSTLVKVRCSYVVWFSRYSCLYRSRPVKHRVS